MTQEVLAGLVGSKKSTISCLETARSAPSLSLLQRICEALNLFFAEPRQVIYSPAWVRVLFIRDAEVAAGKPRPVPARHTHESAAFPVELVPDPAMTRAVPVHGDSMSPEIEDGQTVAVDFAQRGTEACQGRVVAANVPTPHQGEPGPVVKRLRASKRFLILESANRAFPDLKFDRTPATERMILGAVVAVRNDKGECWKP